MKRGTPARRPTVAMIRWMGILLLAAAACQAQDYYPHHNITVGVGAARPRGDLGPLFEDSPAVAVGYGYRFWRYFQADIGLDINFGAARVHDFLSTQIGDLRIKDREYLLQLGGRAILPLAGGRVLFSGGGGGAYLRYGERLNQPSSYYRVGCPVCTSRSGWGNYALVDLGIALDRAQHFRIGPAAKFFRGYTVGDPLGNVPGVRTTDHWMNLLAQISLAF